MARVGEQGSRGAGEQGAGEHFCLRLTRLGLAGIGIKANATPKTTAESVKLVSPISNLKVQFDLSTLCDMMWFITRD